jgi:hypothetical protein
VERIDNIATNNERATARGDTETATEKGNALKGVASLGKAHDEARVLRNEWLTVRWKHDEPHGRLQGAINLHGVERSKPSKSGGTTRTERDPRFGNFGPKEGFRSFWEWTHNITGGGAVFDEPHERSLERGVESPKGLP